MDLKNLEVGMAKLEKAKMRLWVIGVTTLCRYCKNYKTTRNGFGWTRVTDIGCSEKILYKDRTNYCADYKPKWWAFWKKRIHPCVNCSPELNCGECNIFDKAMSKIMKKRLNRG